MKYISIAFGEKLEFLASKLTNTTGFNFKVEAWIETSQPAMPCHDVQHTYNCYQYIYIYIISEAKA